MDRVYLMKANSKDDTPAAPPMDAMEQMAAFDRAFGGK
jgi:hypothetical protein